jgi:hypothetical protein
MIRRKWFVPSLAAALALAVSAAAPAQADAVKADGQDKPTTGKVGEMVPAFAGKVLRGDKQVDFDTRKNDKTTVYILVGVTCPATQPYAERMAALEAAYTPKSVDFVYVYPNQTESIADIKKFHAKNAFTAGLLHDQGAKFTKSLAAMKTGEALIASKKGVVLYRGGIDDNLASPEKVKSKHISTALDEILADKPVSQPSNKNVFG